jgi:hypothetical protein
VKRTVTSPDSWDKFLYLTDFVRKGTRRKKFRRWLHKVVRLEGKQQIHEQLHETIGEPDGRDENRSVGEEVGS